MSETCTLNLYSRFYSGHSTCQLFLNHFLIFNLPTCKYKKLGFFSLFVCVVGFVAQKLSYIPAYLHLDTVSIPFIVQATKIVLNGSMCKYLAFI